MEDLFGIIIFLVFAGVSLLGRLTRQGGAGRGGGQAPPRRPQWPGPVAGPDGIPGFPRPRGAEGPHAESVGDLMPPVEEKEHAKPKAVLPTLGYGSLHAPRTEGIGSEGPSARSAREEAERFTRRTDAFARHQFEQGDLTTLQQPATVFPATDRASALGAALATGPALAQAVVLAEVLGRPKALRGRRR